MNTGRVGKKRKQRIQGHRAPETPRIGRHDRGPAHVPERGINAAPGSPSFHSRTDLFELEVLDGLAPVCKQELAGLIGDEGKILGGRRPDQVTFEFTGNRNKLLKLRTAVAVFQLLYLKVPHPRSITQGENLERLIAAIELVRQRMQFRSFRVGAAGSDSPTFKKIKSIISRKTGLVVDEDAGEMVLRFRRSQLKPFGWDVLIRMTPRPLSARQWRVENMPGALNATVAAAMVMLTEPRPGDRFLNLMCGSGTILAERIAICQAEQLVGVDGARSAIAKANRNLAHVSKQVTLLHEDINKLSLKDRSVSVICADLPWGRLVGQKDELSELYTATLRQAARVCVAGGRFAVLTQENRIFESVLGNFEADWEVLSSFRVKQSDYKPKIYLLRKKGRSLSTKES
jgi:tRNA (guanine6-N2)-methyltransferase